MRCTDFAGSRNSATSDHLFPDEVLAQYLAVRRETELLCEPLAIEDYGIQAMPDVSPPKWHLAHTSWFFETFVLQPYLPGYQVFHPRFGYLFNSYYQTVGSFFPRPQRGLLSRPTVEEVYRYRAHVDAAMAKLAAVADASRRDRIIFRTVLGLHHEQQHQELLLTDIKHIFGTNPLLPAYREDLAQPQSRGETAAGPRYVPFEGGVVEIGARGGEFCFDNELPRHQTLLRPFALADRLVTNGEFLAFVEDGGYARPELWLSDGWAVQSAMAPLESRVGHPPAEPTQGPLYWFRDGDAWYEYRLSGPAPLDLDAPVTHVSYYEADAYARWAGQRLPSEAEWERAAAEQPVAGHFADREVLHPLPPRAPSAGGFPLRQLFGDVWEWTASPYMPYPGYRPLPGTLGEYNGKFMSNQLVLRGGSCVTPPGHVRASYRNFFYPGDRWQFTGIRLAHDL